MKDMGVLKGYLGIRYLMQYAKNFDEDTFLMVQECAPEIRLWCLLTLLCNNMDGLWERVPAFLYEEVFLGKNKDIDYIGFQTDANLSFKEQFKRIRDKLSHMLFTYQDSVVYLDDGTYFDVAWLEKLVLTILSSTKNDLVKGMSDISVFSDIPKDIPLNFDQFWDLGLIQFYRMEILTGNKKTLANYFHNPYLTEEHYTFNLIFESVKDQITHLPIQLNVTKEEYIRELEKFFKILEKQYGNYIKLELVPSSNFEEIKNIPSFDLMSYFGKLQYFINKLKLNDVYSYNSIITRSILKVLQMKKPDIDQVFILRDAGDFLLKVYAHILFSCLYAKEDKNRELKTHLQNNFSMVMHFVHAKNVYKDYLKVIKRCYDEVVENHGPSEYKKHLSELMKQYTQLLDDALNSRESMHMFWNIRNAVVHNQIEFSFDQVKLYITGREIPLKHFSKKKEQWETKIYKNNQVIWELVMDKEEFLRMMDEMYSMLNSELGKKK